MKLLAVVVGALSAFALQAEDDPQGSTPASLAIDAAADETTNVTEVLSGDLMLYVNTNATSTGTVKFSGANTYTGTTTVGGGTLEVTSLAPLGTASSLGVGTNVVFNGGTLHYSGATAATFDYPVTFGASDACTIQNDADLTLSGLWTKSGLPVFTKTGSGKLQFTKSGNTFNTNYVNAGTLSFAADATLSGGIYVFGPVPGSEENKSTLQITGGTLSMSSYQIYVGMNTGTYTEEYWSDFIMSGGTVDIKLFALAYRGKAHVNVDISGGTLATHDSVIGIGFGDTSGQDKYIDFVIRDAGVVKVDDSKYMYTYGTKDHATLTVKDGGTFQVPAIFPYWKTSLPMVVLVDGGKVIWRDICRVFSGDSKRTVSSKSAITTLSEPVRIGTKGVAFSGMSAQKLYRYETAMIASNTVADTAAKGVSFAKGIYALEKANTYDGPTKIGSDATVIAGVTTAIPSASVVTVDAGGSLVVTNQLTLCGGLTLNGDLDLLKNTSLKASSGTVAGSGCVTLYDDAARTIYTSTPGDYKILSVPLTDDNKTKLDNLADTLRNGNAGSFTVTTDSTRAYLRLLITSESHVQPDCLVEGTNGASTVTFDCRGTVVLKDGVKYLQPGSEATLSVSETTGGMYFLGWRDTTTDEFVSTETTATVTPTNYTTYAAVFGPAWFYDSNAKTISNGMWTFKASASGKKLTVTTLSSETTVDGVLNFATPVTNALGESYTITMLGKYSKDSSGPFYNATLEQKLALKRLYLPETLTNIANSAFCNCSNLTGRVTTPASCITIASDSFNSCTGLTSLDLPNVTTIGQSAFSHCEGLTSVRLSNELTAVGQTAFAYAYNLEQVTPFLPDGLKSVGRSAFYKCSKLAGNLIMKNVLNVDYQAFGYASSLTASVYMPSVTNVGYRAFYAVPATNYVFGTSRVYFNDLTTANKGYGYQPFYYASSTVRHFRFPGLAPDLRIVVADSGAAGTTQMFGTSKQNGKTILHGSWRLDPDGWGKILDEVGSSDTTGKTLPTMLRKDREVKGWFKWYNGTTLTWGWLMDTRMFGDHGTGIGYK